jgi:hypothetical protein
MTKPDITGIAPFFIVKDVPAALRLTGAGIRSPGRRWLRVVFGRPLADQ